MKLKRKKNWKELIIDESENFLSFCGIPHDRIESVIAEVENWVSIHCNRSCLFFLSVSTGYDCSGTGNTHSQESRLEACKEYLEAIKVNKTEWKRLTINKMNCLGWHSSTLDVADFLKPYEVEYMVLPMGGWTTMVKHDGRLINNLIKDDTKIVYRFREIDQVEIAWNSYIGNDAWFISSKDSFKAGFKAGQEA